MGKRIWVAGHRGMVGSAVVRRLAGTGCLISTVEREQLDLTQRDAVRAWVAGQRLDAVVLAAARVGGIYANDAYPVEFLRDNLAIEMNVIDAAHEAGVGRLLFLGSSCIYPRDTAQPIPEEALLTAPLEETNEWYALAKIAGIKLCQAYRRQYEHDYISAMPTNLYGPGDRFDTELGHVIPALMHRIHLAKERGDAKVVIWGSGSPLREFMHVDDVADALVFLLERYSNDMHMNVGSGEEISIRDLAFMIAGVVGFQGELHFDTNRPDGTPRKLLDSSRIRSLGWNPRINLGDGMRDTYAWYLDAGKRRLRGG